MSKTESNYHMSKPFIEGYNLPPLQRKIILCLAEHGPQTINECVAKIKHHYKATWIAFQSLEKKGLIQKIDIKEYRGRQYPQFWLSFEGILLSISEKAPKEALRQNIEKYLTEPETKEAILLTMDLADIVGEKFLRRAYSLFINEGKIELLDLALAIRGIRLNKEQRLRIKKAFEKYPKCYQLFISSWKSLKNQIKEMDEVLGIE